MLFVRAWTLYLVAVVVVSALAVWVQFEGPYYQRGIASWYGPGFHGRLTANGETYDMNGISAAHRSLPFDTWVRVTDLDTGRSLDVRINDRGPFVDGRIIDLSRGAAEQLGMVERGIIPVGIRILRWPAGHEPRRPGGDPRGTAANAEGA
jgi:rare lipoprotein A